LNPGSGPVTASAPGGAGGTERAQRFIVAACMAIPAAVLLASYLWLALDHGTLRLWNVAVHESGRYSLGETVLYYSHFLREVPIAVGYALFLLSVSGNTTRGGHGHQAHGLSVPRWVLLLGAGALVGGALLMTALSAGLGSALQDLLQHRTRDDLAGYGTHWRYHWLSTLWFGAFAAVAPTLTRLVPELPDLGVSRFWTRAAWGYFLVVTVIFGLSADIFVDARYAGHQAREIMTHGPVTMLLGLGMLLAWSSGSPGTGTQGPGTRMTRLLWAVVLLVPVHLAVVSLQGDVMAQGQSELGLSAMVAAHYFEHSLDYLLVLLLLLAGMSRGKSRLHPGYPHVASASPT
jgi:hypothetical protein